MSGKEVNKKKLSLTNYKQYLTKWYCHKIWHITNYNISIDLNWIYFTVNKTILGNYYKY